MKRINIDALSRDLIIQLHTPHLLLHLARERNVLFNDALNTFYLRLYGVRHMVKDHSDSEKGNPRPPHRLLLSINSKGSFIHPTDRITHTKAFVTPVVEHWLKREIAHWVHPMKDRTMSERSTSELRHAPSPRDVNRSLLCNTMLKNKQTSWPGLRLTSVKWIRSHAPQGWI